MAKFLARRGKGSMEHHEKAKALETIIKALEAIQKLARESDHAFIATVLENVLKAARAEQTRSRVGRFSASVRRTEQAGG
jgi:hypothetical protein